MSPLLPVPAADAASNAVGSLQERVEKAGGQVLNWNGHRVMGVLAMSRAIGDHCLRPYVIPDPEITVLNRHPDDELLLLASDGLWDVMTCQVREHPLDRWRTFLTNKRFSSDDLAAANAYCSVTPCAEEHLDASPPAWVHFDFFVHWCDAVKPAFVAP